MFKLNSKPQTKKEFEPLPAGSHTAILKEGYVRKVEDKKYDKVKTNVLLRWEVPGVVYMDNEGNELPRSLFLYETLSMGDKSNLHKVLLSNLPSDDVGMTFEDIENPFHIEDDDKHNLTGFYIVEENLFNTPFELVVGKPKGASTFNEIYSATPVEDSPF